MGEIKDLFLDFSQGYKTEVPWTHMLLADRIIKKTISPIRDPGSGPFLLFTWNKINEGSAASKQHIVPTVCISCECNNALLVQCCGKMANWLIKSSFINPLLEMRHLLSNYPNYLISRARNSSLNQVQF